MPTEPAVKRTIAFNLTELVDLIRAVVGYQGRWIKVASAYPDSPTRSYRRGIDWTDWCRIDRAMYDSTLKVT